MSDLPCGPELVGRRVFNPAKPEWGVGTVLSVATAAVGGQPVQRVEVQFLGGRRVVVVPPARLTDPPAEAQRAAGWLDTLGGSTPDERMRSLPDDVGDAFTNPRERLAALARLFVYTDEPASLLNWARTQTQVGDPLAHWSRDELSAAFDEFCRRRDAALGDLAAALRRTGRGDVLQAALMECGAELAERMRSTLAGR